MAARGFRRSRGYLAAARAGPRPRSPTRRSPARRSRRRRWGRFRSPTTPWAGSSSRVRFAASSMPRPPRRTHRLRRLLGRADPVGGQQRGRPEHGRRLRRRAGTGPLTFTVPRRIVATGMVDMRNTAPLRRPRCASSAPGKGANQFAHQPSARGHGTSGDHGAAGSGGDDRSRSGHVRRRDPLPWRRDRRDRGDDTERHSRRPIAAGSGRAARHQRLAATCGESRRSGQGGAACLRRIGGLGARAGACPP